MPKRIVKVRTRFFVAVEGESEQSFFAWLQKLSEGDLHIHLDVVLLGGGGFKSMLDKALRLHKRGSRSGPYRACFLVVDKDRAEQGDWPMAKLKQEATRHGITVCSQRPSHEGLLLRMMPGMETEIPSFATAEGKLKKLWPNYQKPMNASALDRQFSLDDLRRVAGVDADLARLLQIIGLID